MLSIIKSNEAYKKYHIKVYGILGEIMFAFQQEVN